MTAPRARPAEAAGTPVADGPDARGGATSRRRILDAATAEFAALGLAGARTARIAEAAGINNRMIYVYFGSKDALFDAVLEEAVRLVQEAVRFDAVDLPGFALQVFDFYRARPDLARLELWMALERPAAMQSMPRVLSANAAQAEAVREAQAAGTVSAAVDAGQLPLHILALAHGHFTHAADAASWTDQQRAALAVSVAALTGQRPAP
jgi:AcrR family transcriptional regulator